MHFLHHRTTKEDTTTTASTTTATNLKHHPWESPTKSRSSPAILGRKEQSFHQHQRKGMWQKLVALTTNGSAGIETTRSNNKFGLVRDDDPTVTMSLKTGEFSASASLRPVSLKRGAFRSTNVAFSPPSSSLLVVEDKPEQIDYRIQKHQAEELGYMRFQHDDVRMALEDAFEEAKPIFSFEAEIPGDTDIGRDILSHPLIVEAAETLFVTHKSRPEDVRPMARSSDGRTRCTRISLLSPDTGHELLPQISGDQLTKHGLIAAMIQALEATNKNVPRYLRLLLEEEMGYSYLSKTSGETERPRNHRAVFAMTDPAMAEALFGELNGVLRTSRGILQQDEKDLEKAVEVIYDSKLLSYSVLVRHALQHEMANVIYYHSNEERMVAMIEISRLKRSSVAKKLPEPCTIKPFHDPKHDLRATPMRFVPLTGLQATRANSLIHFGKFNEAVQLLSPRQGTILMKAMRTCSQKTFYDVVDYPILLAWLSVCQNTHPKLIDRCTDPAEVVSSDDGDCTEPLPYFVN